ncbi:hypothetical protein OROMI_019897 [Orobanche minor]
MSASKRAIISIAGSNIIITTHVNYFEPFLSKYAPCFSSVTHQGATTPERLSQKDGTLDGSEGGYGGSGISNAPNQAVGTRRPDRREDTDDAARDMAEMAKAGAVGALEAGLKFGEAAKQAMDGMWDAAKKTIESTRDAVADDGDINRTSGGQAEDPRRGPRGYKY